MTRTDSYFSYLVHFLKGAILSCTRLQRAHMEGTSLRSCNFEDPAGTRANLEGKRFPQKDGPLRERQIVKQRATFTRDACQIKDREEKKLKV